MDMMGLNRKRGDGTWRTWMQWMQWRERMKHMKRRKAAVGTWLVDGVLWIALSLLTLLLACPSWAATYYVDCNATSGGDGSLATPWDTIADINGATLSPGDNVYLKRGCTFREQLTVPNSGSAGSPITFGAYGSGANPIISCYDLVDNSTWTTVDKIYDWYPGYGVVVRTMLRDGLLIPKDTSSSVNADYYYYSSGQMWYKPPAGHAASEYTLEAARRYRAVYVNGKDYVTFNDLTVQGGNGNLYSTDGATFDIKDSTHITLNNILVRYSWITGLYIKAATRGIEDITVQNSEISYSGNGIHVHGDSSYGVTNVTFDNLHIHNIAQFENDTRGFSSLDREGIGINGYGISSGFTLSNIIVHDVGDNVSANNLGIFFYKVNNVLLRNFLVYNCARAGVEVVDGAYGCNNVLAYGIVHSNGKIATNDEAFSGGVIIKPSYGTGMNGTKLLNSIIYNNDGLASNDPNKRGGLVVYKNFTAPLSSSIEIKNNIISCNITNDLLIYENTGALSGLSSDYNLFYRKSGNAIVYNNKTYDYQKIIGDEAGYYSYETSRDTHSINSDPKLTSTTNFHLLPGSPAINAGVDVGLTTDIEGTDIEGYPEIGAYEYPLYAYYIAQTASGDGSGVSNDNYMSVARHNAGVFNADNNLYLCGTIASTVAPPSAGTSGHPIVYDGACPGSPGIIDGKNNIAFGVGDGSTTGKIFLTIKNLEIKNLTGVNAAAGIWLRSVDSVTTADLYVTVDNCKIHDVVAGDTKASAGVDARGVGLTVANSEIYNIYYDGIYSDGADLTVSNCYIYNVDNNSGTAGGDCIQAGSPVGAWIHHNKLDHSAKASKHCVIVSNSGAVVGSKAIIEHNEMIMPIAAAGDSASRCAAPEDNTNGTIFRYNKLTGSYNAITPLGSVDLHHNTVVSATNSYVNWQSASAASSVANIYNNTFIGETSYGVYFTADKTLTINIKNNIIYNGNKGIRQSASGGDNTIAIDYNDIYSTTTAYTNVTGGDHDSTVDPLFTSSTDFHLRLGSPAINAGVNVCTAEGVPFATCTGAGTGTWTDIKGSVVPHNGKISIGAYQFTSFDTEQGESAARKSWRRVFRKF